LFKYLFHNDLPTLEFDIVPKSDIVIAVMTWKYSISNGNVWNCVSAVLDKTVYGVIIPVELGFSGSAYVTLIFIVGDVFTELPVIDGIPN
jgi:hypothetical protein